MKIYTNFKQHNEDGSPNEEWLKMRATRFSGSDFYLFMSLLKKGELTETAESKLYEKVLANFGDYPENITSSAMERGTELEPEARELYKQETFNDVQEVGFVDWETLYAGCSPDGVVYFSTSIINDEVWAGDHFRKIKPKKYVCIDRTVIDKIIEIKCPGIKNYIKMAKGKIPMQYLIQMQYNMLITGAKSCDFVIYHPRMRLVIKNIKSDEQMQKDIQTVLEKLNPMYDEILSDIETMRN